MHEFLHEEEYIYHVKMSYLLSLWIAVLKGCRDQCHVLYYAYVP